MLKTYTDNYMNVLKNTYKSMDELKDEQLHAKVDTGFLNIKEVKTSLANEISKHYGISKAEAAKLLKVEELKSEG
ncbi:hypothetical protein [Lysinibacillus sp. FSL M8-0355]|uniref:hypothetical protein n=1 Tax=Lysinibacillus sp. FSL M8-0355 TaxID=2921719 RepID=UPI0030FB6C09